jgi:hypothetical protein
MRAEERDRLGLRSLGRHDQRFEAFPLTDGLAVRIELGRSLGDPWFDAGAAGATM